MSTYTPGQKRRASNILKKMRQVPENEMMLQDVYVSDGVVKPRLQKSGAICQGHQACAVGSFMLAAGCKVEISTWTDAKGKKHEEWADIFGSDERERDELFAEDKGAELAYACLNAAAEAYAEATPGVHPDRSFDDAAEQLFEGQWPFDGNEKFHKLLNREMIKVIDDARERVRATPSATR